jgi:hypothetical protein
MTRLFLPERFGQKQTNPMANKSKSSASQPGSNENIEIPPISKTAAGAATGAVIGAVGGPVGAVVGGVIGAAVGKRAESDKPMMPRSQARRTTSGPRSQSRCENRPCRSACGKAHREVESERRRRPVPPRRSPGRKNPVPRKRRARRQRSRVTKIKKPKAKAKSRSSARKTRRPATARRKKARR